MPDGERLWRTDDGDLVPEDHPDARYLAYGVADDLTEADKGNVRGSGRSHTPKAEAGATPKKKTAVTPKVKAPPKAEAVESAVGED